jgi:hypothetical protein
MKRAPAALLVIALSGCAAPPRHPIDDALHPQLVADSAWVVARAVTYVNAITVAQGYPSGMNQRYRVTEFVRSDSGVRMWLRPVPVGLGGGVHVAVLVDGRVRVLDWTQ